jgi:adenosylcobinamide kinase/adenosylcobinamide-phosphate guanylyltransferase
MFYDYSLEYTDQMKSEMIEKILADIIKINTAVANLIVISNEIFSCGITYDRATEEYIDVLGQLHIKIAAAAQMAIECEFGNNTIYKGGTQ